MSSSGRYTIRDATLADAAVIADIYNEYVSRGTCTMDQVPATEESVAKTIRGFSPRETYLLLEDEQGVMGWGIIKRYSDRAGYRMTCETSVYLRSSLTGKGYGKVLKSALIERCREYKYHHLVAKIFADNESSIAYNKNFGYEVVGRQRQIGFVNGKWQDITIMQLILDDVPPFQPEVEPSTPREGNS